MSGSPASEQTNTGPDQVERGRGRGGGGRRGRRRGRGRGRGGAPQDAHDAGLGREAPSSTAVQPPTSRGGRGRGRGQAPKPRLTHFIAVPLGHNPAFRESMSTFTDALLAVDPPIRGLDSTIVMPARRMHFTLGVMSLDSDDPARSVDAAAKLLNDIRPRVQELLRGDKLRVSLDCMGIMRPEGCDDERAHVMWVGPAAGGAVTDKFEAVAHLVQKAFLDAGLLVDEGRPLKLHCTILNTIYRKPRPRQRVPFSYPSVLASDAVKPVLAQTNLALEKDKKGLVKVDFGTWEVNELQICEMGSSGPEGEYVAAARCSLT